MRSEVVLRLGLGGALALAATGCAPKAAPPAAEPTAAPAAAPAAEKPPETKPPAKPVAVQPPAPEPQPLPAARPETVQKIKGLLKGLDSEVADERAAAWQEIKDMGDLATPALAEAARTGTPPERRNAIDAIGQLKDRSAAAVLRKALADEDAEVRWRAARALGEVGDAGARTLLAQALAADRNADVRENAAYALASLGGAEGFAFFKEALKAPEADRRSRAVLALGKYGKEKFIPELAAALKDQSAAVRKAAVIQLGEIRHKDAVQALIAALGDEDYKVRERARSGLEKITLQTRIGSDKANWEYNKAKWEEWWAANKDTFKLSAAGTPEPYRWANAVALKGDADFKKQVEEAKGLVAVHFHAAADRDCISVAAAVDKLAAEYRGKLRVCEAEARANVNAIRKLELKTAPSLVIFKDGKPLETVAGAKDEEELRTILKEHLDGTRKLKAAPEPEKPPAPAPEAEKPPVPVPVPAPAPEAPGAGKTE